MKLKSIIFVAIALLLSFNIGNAQVTVNYQPTPYPNSVDSDIHHIVDGWLNNSSNTAFVRDDKLQVGGSGDIYRTYLKFDLEGLPDNVSQVKLWLKTFARGDSSSTTSFSLGRVSSSWDENMTWATLPSIGPSVTYGPATVGLWWGMDITSWYQAWQQGTATNNGVMLSPSSTNNRFNMFRSSRYTSSERPYLQLTFTQQVSTPTFKMPLPGGVAWLVTTEAGGWDCKGNIYDPAHDGSNYFSIDFSHRNLDPSTQVPVYSADEDVPVLAAANGTVIENAGGPNHPNGYYVVLQHSNGFSTRYLHLKEKPSLPTTVSAGDQIGIMGTTGCCDANGNPTSTAVHLHFGMRYNNSGSSSQSALRHALLDGRLLKSYQTKCTNNLASGDYAVYHISSNREYPDP
jgi:murein DD-endopeptidase MepM/ murein hydrolase activator NlpD